ncbi:cytochrome bc1 complex Rieske iron-sulfur subunit [Tessaracoccus defluvii]|uniref:Cytochrome bc1 complex Rieske iron-sulfur subunit n=1 Tax=Tessaracoccus defluvii TaxID=1285901 RepID=A0A7H0H735_9ACTN|nr:Rieske 2Fe-2S domain-containing protein [Tessaracoccus defluvii]QNP56351.1 Rieske 2Fe-2S domain-containing protein [Tessaracoccus defluvii]
MTYENRPVRDPELGHVVADPGLPEHVERYNEVDEAAGNRAYAAVLAMFAAVPVLAVLFVVIYFAVPRDAYIDFGWLQASAMNVGLGLTAGVAVTLIGVGMVQWARAFMGDHETIDPRHSAGSSPEDHELVAHQFEQGVEQSGIRRRPLLLGAFGGAVGFAVIPAVVLFADMGPHPTAAKRRETIETTIWAEGVRLVNDENWIPLRPENLEIGQLVNAQPENLEELHGTEAHQAKAKSSIIVVRMDPNSIRIPESRKDWHVSGILAYSKICTHVGCPISLWERQTHHLLCPCHQSTFDLGNSGVVVFGPAARALPQLAIRVNDKGYLVAQGDFSVPVGPSYFERDSRNDFQDGDQ